MLNNCFVRSSEFLVHDLDLPVTGNGSFTLSENKRKTGWGKTGNLVINFSRQGKHGEFNKNREFGKRQRK